jgi:hypothetical protein
MNSFWKQFLAFGIAGIITTLSSLNAVLDKIDVGDVSDGQWVKIVTGGVIAALAGWRTLLATPPQR